LEGHDAGRPALTVEERGLARRWRRARQQAQDGAWLMLGVVVVMALTPFSEGSRIPQELVAFVRTMALASFACLACWAFENFVLVARRLRALSADRAGGTTVE
jgi:hypothetical protein